MTPCDHRLAGLAADLAATSDAFRDRWARHDVRVAPAGVRRIHHPVAGDLELPFETTPLASDPGQTLLMYPAEPEVFAMLVGCPQRESATPFAAAWS